jgi:hypothetical protein
MNENLGTVPLIWRSYPVGMEPSLVGAYIFLLFNSLSFLILCVYMSSAVVLSRKLAFVQEVEQFLGINCSLSHKLISNECINSDSCIYRMGLACISCSTSLDEVLSG